MKVRKQRFEKDGVNPPLRQLKLATADDRAWAAELGKTMTSAQARAAIKERLGIDLRRDTQYSDFCSWQFSQREWDLLGDLVTSDAAILQDRFPGMSREKIRDAAIKRTYATAEILGDPRLRLKVVELDQREESGRFKAQLETAKAEERRKSLDLEERRVKLLEQKAAKADAAERVMEEALTPEEKLTRMKQIFGMQ